MFGHKVYFTLVILTLFYHGNGTLITEAEAQMTCMKTIDSSVESDATKSSGENEDKTNVGMLINRGNRRFLPLLGLDVGLYL